MATWTLDFADFQAYELKMTGKTGKATVCPPYAHLLTLVVDETVGV